MTDAPPESAPQLPSDTVQAVARVAIGRPTALVHSWRVSPVHGGATKTALWRVSGTARVDSTAGPPLHWSIVLKCKSHDDARAGAVPEVEAYRSGLLDRIGEEGFGLVAPRCYRVEPRPPPVAGEDAETWLWLQDVADLPAGPWPSVRYGLAAYHLGLFNGSLPNPGTRATPPPAFDVPPYPWLGSGFLAYWLEMMDQSWDLGRIVLAEGPHERAAWDHPLVREHFPTDLRERLAQAWLGRHALQDALQRLPRTLAHGDAHRRNLLSQRMADAGDRTVAVDWAVIGYAPLGEDPGHLLTSSLLLEADPPDAAELDVAIFGRYLDGLRDAGWRLTRRLRNQVRFGYAAHGLLNMGLFVGAGAAAGFAQPWIRRWYEGVTAQPFESLVPRMARITRFTLSLGDEARSLARP